MNFYHSSVKRINMRSAVQIIQDIPIIDNLLKVICRTTGMGFAAIAYVTPEQWLACAVRDEIAFGLVPGDELKIETTLCNEVMDGRVTVVIDHVAQDQKYACHHTPAMYGFQSYISAPIIMNDGKYFGTLCAIDPKPARLNNPETIGMFELYAQLIAFHLSAEEQVLVSGALLANERRAVDRQTSLTEELTSTNEQLNITNEKLIETNKRLAAVNDQLKAANHRIEEREVALRLAIDAAQFGTWFIHSVTREFITDARLKELFGYLPEEDLSIEQALGQITDEYREYVAHKLEEAIYHNGDYDVIYPVIGKKDGILRWLRAIGNLKSDPTGAFSAFTGVVMDITQQKQAADTLQSAYEQLRLSKEAAQLGFFDMDLKKGTMEWDTRCRELFGISHDLPVTFENDFVIGLHQEDRERIITIINDAFVKSIGNGVYDVEYRTIATGNGQLRWVRAKGQVYFDQGDHPVRFIGSVLDITEQKLDQLRKNDFIAMASHELKTPITSLSGFLQLLNKKAKKTGDEFAVSAYTRMGTQVKKMVGLIEGFLDLSRLDAGKIHLDLQRFSLNELVLEVADLANALYPSHEVVILSPASTMQLTADRNKIEQVLSNLISNAVKYSPMGRVVKVEMAEGENEIVVNVKDEGMGISSENLMNIFERYYRVETSYTENIAGFGIGLHLCSEIVKRHNGKIWAESELGMGSTFYFSIPQHL